MRESQAIVNQKAKTREMSQTDSNTSEDSNIQANQPQVPQAGNPKSHQWTFFTNHTHVLVCLAKDPTLPLRVVAEQIGITERAVQRLVANLEGAGVITKIKEGRQNRYELHLDQALRHPLEGHKTIGEVLDIVINLK